MQKAFNFSWRVFVVVLFGASALARADIYTCKHPDGSTEITDSPCARGATVVSVLKSARPAAQPTSLSVGSTKTVQNQSNGAASMVQNGANGGGAVKLALAARVEPGVQRNRDDIRRRVLSSELEIEEKSLSEAKATFNGGSVQPLADESPNSPKYLERRARVQQTLVLHEKNVAAIRQELANLR